MSTDVFFLNKIKMFARIGSVSIWLSGIKMDINFLYLSLFWSYLPLFGDICPYLNIATLFLYIKDASYESHWYIM